MTEKLDNGVNLIELRIESVPQIFHSLDPSPFRERELDKSAEEFIVSCARDLPSHASFKIVVHLPEDQLAKPGARDITPAITQFFSYRADLYLGATGAFDDSGAGRPCNSPIAVERNSHESDEAFRQSNS
jgi:hypothetical protein